MINNKKLIIIIASVLVVAVLGVGAVLYLGKEKVPVNNLPVVTEPTTTPPTTSTPSLPPEIDNSNIGLPKSDNEGKDSLITEEQPTKSEEEINAIIKYEEEKEKVVNELTPEQIAEANKKIEEAKKEAAANPGVVQEVVQQPIETEPVIETPQKDADGFVCTKEEAVREFTSMYQKLIDANSSSYRLALEEAKKREDFTQESFDADLKQLMTDPYSSPILASALDEYRRVGQSVDSVIYCAAQWLAMGGDDGDWAETVVQ